MRPSTTPRMAALSSSNRVRIAVSPASRRCSTSRGCAGRSAAQCAATPRGPGVSAAGSGWAARSAAATVRRPLPARRGPAGRAPRRCRSGTPGSRPRNRRPGPASSAARFDRAGITAEFVHEPQVVGLRAGPDAALRNRVDLLRRLLARLRHPADELAVRVFDALLHDRTGSIAECAIAAKLAGQRRGADAVGVHAEFLERALEGREHREDADRAGQRRRASTGRLPSRCSSRPTPRAAHRRDDRLRGAASRDLAADHFARRTRCRRGCRCAARRP